MTLRQRLLAADVDHRAGQMTFLERLDQVSIDHRHAAPDVDEQRRGLEAGEQPGIEQVMGLGGVGQQVDDVIHVADDIGHLLQGHHLGKRRLAARRRRHAVHLDAERQEKPCHALADVTGPDNQHLAPGQALAGAVIPLALDLAHQPGQHFALVTQHVGQYVFGHDLAEDTHRAGQPVIGGQALAQQRGDAGPGRLHPLRLVALAQQAGQQVGLAQPHGRIAGQAGQPGRVAAAQDVEIGCGLAQQPGVEGVIMFGNQDAHAGQPCSSDRQITMWAVDGATTP